MEKLKQRTGKSDVEVADMISRPFLEEKTAAEAAAEPPAAEAPVSGPPEKEIHVPPARARETIEPVTRATESQKAALQEYADFMDGTGKFAEKEPEKISDITDRVVILDDEADVERFVKTFPEPKRVNIKTLLRYLDGLFEKLPEEIIRKFASSDYFNLYLKVLNELGV